MILEQGRVDCWINNGMLSKGGIEGLQLRGLQLCVAGGHQCAFTLLNHAVYGSISAQGQASSIYLRGIE